MCVLFSYQGPSETLLHFMFKEYLFIHFASLHPMSIFSLYVDITGLFFQTHIIPS